MASLVPTLSYQRRMRLVGKHVDIDHLTELTVRFQSGESAVFRDVIDHVTPVVAPLCLRFLRVADDADDAFQETTLRVWQRLHTLRDPRASLAWVCRIAKNVSIDMARAKNRRRQCSLDASFEDEAPHVDTLEASWGDPHRDVVNSQRRAQVQLALARLSIPFRTIIRLRHIEECSYQEIAVRLGLCAGTVESRLHRARLKLAVEVKALQAADARA